MKHLKFKYDLDCKVAICVPSTINVNEKIDNSEYVISVIRELSSMFGGATASDAVGGWVSESGETIIEHVKIVYSFCSSEQLNEKFDDVYEICQRIKREMGQEAVTLEVNGQCKFV